MVARQPSLLGLGEPAVRAGAPVERVELDDRCWVDLGRGWLDGADTLLDLLVERVEWAQHRRWMYGRMVDDPRLTARLGHDDALPHPVLDDIRAALEQRYRIELGGVGLNFYRDGRDSVAPHRDRELRDVEDGLVAIVTLGGTRPFLVRPHGGGRSRDLSPASGDLLVMGGAMQAHWEHGVPKVAHAQPRISCTWRWSRPT